MRVVVKTFWSEFYCSAIRYFKFFKYFSKKTFTGLIEGTSAKVSMIHHVPELLVSKDVISINFYCHFTYFML